MSQFEPGLIEKLQAEWPEVDVQQLAAEIPEDVKNPSSLLTWKVKRSRPSGVSHDSEQTKASEHAGYWNLDGTWIFTGEESDYWQAPTGSVTRFVRRLVWLRRQDRLTPADVATLVLEHRKEFAFPLWRHWVTPPETRDGAPLYTEDWWHSVPVSTSAESAVKYLGLGSFYTSKTEEAVKRGEDPEEAVKKG